MFGGDLVDRRGIDITPSGEGTGSDLSAAFGIAIGLALGAALQVGLYLGLAELWERIIR